MSYDDKCLTQRPTEPAPKPWDSARHLAPDPAWSDDRQLRWYSAATLVLGLNSSEVCRQKACEAGDRAAATIEQRRTDVGQLAALLKANQ